MYKKEMIFHRKFNRHNYADNPALLVNTSTQVKTQLTLAQQPNGFLPSWDGGNTTVWMHPMDTNNMHWVKTREELLKNAMYYFEEIQDTTPQTTVAVQPLTSSLTNHSSKTCWALLEKQVQTQKRHFSMDSFTWTYQCWLTRKDLLMSATCRHWM